MDNPSADETKLDGYKGTVGYADWLKSLSQEDYDAHLEERKAKRQDKVIVETMQEMARRKFEENSEELTAALLKQAQRLVLDQELTPQGFAILSDRVLGKPKESVDVTSDGSFAPITIVEIPLDEQ